MDHGCRSVNILNGKMTLREEMADRVAGGSALSGSNDLDKVFTDSLGIRRTNDCRHHGQAIQRTGTRRACPHHEFLGVLQMDPTNRHSISPVSIDRCQNTYMKKEMSKKKRGGRWAVRDHLRRTPATPKGSFFNSLVDVNHTAPIPK